MRSFPLQIVTADGMVFDGQAESISVRAAGGDMSVQAGHCDYVTVLGMGQARLIVDGKVRTAACIGGMLAVADGKVRLVPTTFEPGTPRSTPRRISTVIPAKQTPGNTAILRRSISAR